MMAFDVAMLQDKYGANTSTTEPATTPTPCRNANAPGTMFACIWDGGGDATGSATPATRRTIDLRAATIDYSPTGGGAISYVAGIIGGYTIAQRGGDRERHGRLGDDPLTGNNAQNILEGLGGGDRMYGRGGGDDLFGGSGRDALFGGDGADDLTGGGGRDALYGGAGGDRFIFLAVGVGGKEIDRILDLEAGDEIDLSAVDADLRCGREPGLQPGLRLLQHRRRRRAGLRRGPRPHAAAARQRRRRPGRPQAGVGR